MITLKTNPYNEKELLRLAFLLETAEHILSDSCANNGVCKTCDYRHLCYDISEAKKFVEDKCVEEIK